MMARGESRPRAQRGDRRRARAGSSPPPLRDHRADAGQDGSLLRSCAGDGSRVARHDPSVLAHRHASHRRHRPGPQRGNRRFRPYTGISPRSSAGAPTRADAVRWDVQARGGRPAWPSFEVPSSPSLSPPSGTCDSLEALHITDPSRRYALRVAGHIRLGSRPRSADGNSLRHRAACRVCARLRFVMFRNPRRSTLSCFDEKVPVSTGDVSRAVVSGTSRHGARPWRGGIARVWLRVRSTRRARSLEDPGSPQGGHFTDGPQDG